MLPTYGNKTKTKKNAHKENKKKTLEEIKHAWGRGERRTKQISCCHLQAEDINM
jgi:hypothetical protein